MPDTPNPSDPANLDPNDPANLDPNDPASRQWLNDHTVIFDFSDFPVDEEELAARQALRELQHAFRSYRRNKTAPTPPPLLPPPPAVASAPEPVQPAAAPPTANPPPAPVRSKGGQPGNNNALKYGFYSRRMPLRELEGLDQTAVTSLKDEIDVMRVFSRKVAELGADVEDLSDAKDLLRVMSLATTSINRLVRTHTRIPDPELDPAWLLKTALLELEDEWPELKAFGDRFRNKPDPDQPSDQPSDQPPARPQP